MAQHSGPIEGLDVFKSVVVEPICGLVAYKRLFALWPPPAWPCLLLPLWLWQLSQSAGVEVGNCIFALPPLDPTSHWALCGTIWLWLVDLVRSIDTGPTRISPWVCSLDSNSTILSVRSLSHLLRILVAANADPLQWVNGQVLESSVVRVAVQL